MRFADSGSGFLCGLHGVNPSMPSCCGRGVLPGGLVVACIVAMSFLHASNCAYSAQTARPEIDRLVENLTSEDAAEARAALKSLQGMGAEVVPTLFDRLVSADWNTRCPLLQVLAIHGRDFSRLKLLHGTRQEKPFAAILYQLIDQGEHPEPPEYPAMVDALLAALKSEDKRLRAAAGLALVDAEESTLFFDHFHEIIPALISSFDTDLIIDRRRRGDPTEVVFVGICIRLDALIGDRPVYLATQPKLWKNVGSIDYDHYFAYRTALRQALAANHHEIDRLRTYWESWWNEHSMLSATDIGRLMIERSLPIISPGRLAQGDMQGWRVAKHEQDLFAEWCLRLWTGWLLAGQDDWRSFWARRKATYKGPVYDSGE